MIQSLQTAVKILVVDDETDMEPMIRQKFRRHIRENTFDFEFASNGLEALEKIVEFPEIGIVLSDINMPEMDGLTLLSKLNELKNPGLKTVMVSAYGDIDNIRTAMNRGAFDFITKPVNFEDLEITIKKTIEEIISIRRWLTEHDQLVSIQHDLNISRDIQQAILPKEFPPFPEEPNFDIYASMVAANEVGGDFYDFFLIDKDRLGFVIGDVSGKGISAAIFMAVSRTLVRATGLKGDSVSDCMRYVNNLLCIESVSSMFVTVFYGILNTQTGEVDYVNAGHNPPYLLSTEGISKVEMTNGLALGVMDDFNFESKKLHLKKGDQLLLYTDGVVEAFNLEETAYGEEKFENFLNENRNHSVETIIKRSFADVNDFVAGAPQSDDITLLGITFKG
ncbi:SpoIIE family protein phosphatase [uncultured Sunxiuqinia sp.]|mgnify:CR=1 FL=1|uniref:PP2C family protein-serine/threonine phosphatase n=1 Tax=uncultured Sunxiuqinia sp. TaxID=1573825 RepID=UPI0030DCE500